MVFPACGVGVLQDMLENIKRSGGVIDRFGLEMTKHVARYGCLQCGALIGEKALKDLISSP